MKAASILALVGGLTAASLAQPPQVREALHQAYDALTRAYNSGNVDAIMQYTTPDFNWRLSDGKTISRAAARASIKQELSKIQSGHWRIDIQSVVAQPVAATVVVTYTFRGIMLDNSNKPYRATFMSKERQNWLKTPSGWKQTMDAELDQKVINNGRTSLPNIDTTKPVLDNPQKQFPKTHDTGGTTGGSS